MKQSTFYYLSILILIIFPTSNLTCSEQYHYFGDKHSMIEWSRIDLERWLDFEHWENGRKRRDDTPEWKNVIRDMERRERIGKVIACVGECLVIRDGTSFHASYRTTLLELDEFTTLENSYAWLYLPDGTVVRVSPKSSITLKDFNVGVDSFFIHARVNVGNVFWLARSNRKFKEVNKRETDAVFLPLQMRDANTSIQELKFDDDEKILSLMRDKDKYLKRYRKLNELIDLNNLTESNKRTIVWLVTPGGSLWSDFLQADIYALFGSDTFVRNRSTRYYQYSEEKENSTGKVFIYPHKSVLNGKLGRHQDVRPTLMTEGIWYKLASNGMDLSTYHQGEEEFKMGEFPTIRIPSILIARELWFKKYSSALHNKEITEKELAEVHGYRFWGKSNNVHSDFVRRALFLKRHTRKNEQSLLRALKALKQLFAKRGEEFDAKGIYGPHFYGQALNRYLNPRKIEIYQGLGDDLSNSTQKAYWKMIHEDESLSYPRFGKQ